MNKLCIMDSGCCYRLEPRGHFYITASDPCLPCLMSHHQVVCGKLPLLIRSLFCASNSVYELRAYWSPIKHVWLIRMVKFPPPPSPPLELAGILIFYYLIKGVDWRKTINQLIISHWPLADQQARRWSRKWGLITAATITRIANIAVSVDWWRAWGKYKSIGMTPCVWLFEYTFQSDDCANLQCVGSIWWWAILLCLVMMESNDDRFWPKQNLADDAHTGHFNVCLTNLHPLSQPSLPRSLICPSCIFCQRAMMGFELGRTLLNTVNLE